MAPSNRRERELARLKSERQASRRTTAQQGRRKTSVVVVAVVAAVAVVGGLVALGVGLDGTDGDDQVVTQADDAGADDAADLEGAGATEEPVTEPEPATPGECAYPEQPPAARPVEPPPTGDDVVREGTATMTLDVAMAGQETTLTVQLDAAGTPCTTNALVSLAQQDYFDDTVCHRLVTDGIFVLQCGDPTAMGNGGPGYRYLEELDTAEAVQTYAAGTIAMANTGQPGSTGSQFFINYEESPLPPLYTLVGQVTEGLEAVQAVAAEGTESGAPDGAPAAEARLVSVDASYDG